MTADQFDENHRTDRTFIGKEFKDRNSFRRERILYKVFESNQDQLEREIDLSTEIDSLVLHEHTNRYGRVEVRAYLYTDSRDVDKVLFLRFDDDCPDHNQVTLPAESLRQFSILLTAIRALPLEHGNIEQFDNDLVCLLAETMTEGSVRKLLKHHPDIVRSLVDYELTQRDVAGVGHRKQQLSIFEQMLDDPAFFRTKQDDWGKTKPEDVWQ